jgi:hypothetical protein
MFSSSAVPPKLKPASLAGFAVGLLALAGLPLAAVVFCFNPSTHAFYPVCQFHQLTGWNCPSCGATRGLYALLHGDWRTALRDNALMLAAMVLLPVRGAWWLRKNSGGAAGSFFPAAWLWPLLAVLLVFGVLRNLPAFAFLSPA